MQKTNKLEELYKHCTRINIQPHNSSIPSPVTIQAHVSCKAADGYFHYANINVDGGDLNSAISRLHHLVMGFISLVGSV